MSGVTIEKPLIRAESLGKVFGTQHQRVVALDDVSVSLYGGELSLLMGPSGSGKSSMIAALGGLQKPDAGTVTAMNRDVWKQGAGKVNKFRREYCGFVFQTVGLFPALNALEQIMLPLTYLGWSSKKAKQDAMECLAEVGLEDRFYSLPGEMSGGQNQRVAIARMLAKNPRLIFCDEPTSALDGENGARVAELLKAAARTHNAMILCVTHDERLRAYADRILEIEDGKIFKDSRENIQ